MAHIILRSAWRPSRIHCRCNAGWQAHELRIPTPYGFLAAQEWTKGNGEKNLLMLHGYQDNASSFDNLVPHLDPRWRIVALDFTGQGLSSHLPRGSIYSTDVFMMDIRRAITFLGWKEYSLLGHSMGGLTGHHYAATFPREVEKLVVLDGFCPMHVPPSKVCGNFRRIMSEHLRLEGKGESDATSYTEEEIVKLYTDSALVPYLPEDARCLMKRGCRRTADGRYVLNRDYRIKATYWNRVGRLAMIPFFQNFRNEMLVVNVVPGLGVSPVGLRKLASACETSCSKFVFTVIEGNHHVHMNKAAEVGEHVRKFLEGTTKIK
ncbi:serine hydrolase-like protein [Ornithodoros turicata]|uniref:serine hydrolase-like protein n=1 Tax=Ornithodoros turicata TaxID=34597 RepID=UPI00313995FD